MSPEQIKKAESERTKTGLGVPFATEPNIPNWLEADAGSPEYIENKPNIEALTEQILDSAFDGAWTSLTGVPASVTSLSGTNTGDQTSIVGITGTRAQFNSALTDGDFLYVGDITLAGLGGANTALSNLASVAINTDLIGAVAGGMGIRGGIAANDDLILEGTIHATRATSYVQIQPNGGLTSVGAVDANSNFNIAFQDVSNQLNITAARSTKPAAATQRAIKVSLTDTWSGTGSVAIKPLYFEYLDRRIITGGTADQLAILEGNAARNGTFTASSGLTTNLGFFYEQRGLVSDIGNYTSTANQFMNLGGLVFSTAIASPVVNKAGGAGFDALNYYAQGFTMPWTTAPTTTLGTSDYMVHGYRVSFAGTPTGAGTLYSLIYGMKVTGTAHNVGTNLAISYYNSLTGAGTVWNIYNDTDENNYLGGDNSKTYFGTGANTPGGANPAIGGVAAITSGGAGDASVYYDGTDLIINPKEIGTGMLSILSGIRLEAKAGTATDGDAWNDSTQEALQAFVSGIEQTLVGTIFTQTADKAVTNTTSETSIIGTGVGTLTLPANFFVVGKTIRITMSGVYSTVSVTGDIITIKVKYGSTVLASKATTALVTGGTNLAWFADLLVTCRTTGGTGTVQVSGGVAYQIAGSVTVKDEMNNGVATTTLDTTSSGLLDITVTHGTANASNSVKSLVGAFEVLN